MNRCTWVLGPGLSLFAGSAITADPILVAKPVPIADDAMTAGWIRKECDIQNQLADYLVEYARAEQQIEVKHQRAQH